jgi:UDP-glucose 4-epimerase
MMGNIVITGKEGYIGAQLEAYLNERGHRCRSVSVRDGMPDFAEGETVIHAAAVGPGAEHHAQPYYDVNTTLTNQIARHAKAHGVRHFIFLSTMSVFGEQREGLIDPERTEPFPKTHYAHSKMMAEMALCALEGDGFNVAYLRLPPVYGFENAEKKKTTASSDNRNWFGQVARAVERWPVLPLCDTRRSILHIDNLCSFMLMLVEDGAGGVYGPQDRYPVSVGALLRSFAEAMEKRRVFSKMLGRVVKPAVLGDFIYDADATRYYGETYNERAYGGE